jgi:hypothetical protein
LDIATLKGLEFLGGATLSGVIDGILNWYLQAHPEAQGKFPYIPTTYPLPQLNSWLVLGVSAVPYALGKLTKKETVANIGGGMLTYAVPMVIHHIIVGAAAPGLVVTRAR